MDRCLDHLTTIRGLLSIARWAASRSMLDGACSFHLMRSLWLTKNLILRRWATLALLISPTNGQREIHIVRYQTALANNLNQNTMRLGRNNVSIKVTQEAFSFVVQCTTPENKRALQDFLTIVMRATMAGGNNLNPVRLLWASQRIDYLGYIMENQLGAQRFEVGPYLSFSMLLAKDELNTITNDYSTGGDYTGIYDGQVFTEDDFIPPPSGGNTDNPPIPRGPVEFSE